MQLQQQSAVVGVFEDRKLANEAIGALIAAGFAQKRIGAAMRYNVVESEVIDERLDAFAAARAITDVLDGLGLRSLSGLGVSFQVIPILGPAIAVGTLREMLSFAEEKGAVSGLLETLRNAGIPDEQADIYQCEFEVGRTLVIVEAQGRQAEAATILRSRGGSDKISRNKVSLLGQRFAASSVG